MSLPIPQFLQGTPMRPNADGKDRFAFIKRQAAKKREDHWKEMIGLIVGPVPVREYLDKFVPLPAEKALPPTPKITFEKVPLEATRPQEKTMYTPLIEQFKRLTPGFEWFLTANETGTDDVLIRPDISFIEAGRWPDVPVLPVQPEKASKKKGLAAMAAGLVAKITGYTSEPIPVTDKRPYDWKRCEFGVEVKRSSKEDAFLDAKESTVESNTKKGRSHRGQLISYVKEQMSRQHRTGLHQVFICGDYARLLFFDRSGGVVTERFNYHEHPEILADFLWRYSHLPQTSRGWDPTVTAATEEETRLFDERVGEFVKDRGRAPEVDLNGLSCERFADCLDANYPTYKIDVASPQYSATLIIRRPFFEPFSPIGRATRGYVAYDATTDKVLFLKDTWRTDHRGRMSEPEVYAFLQANGISNLPNILYAADVQAPDGRTQRTFVDEFSAAARDRLRPFSHPLRGHVHCRIVQELIYPLSSFRDSKELVRVLRDALKAIKAAYEAGRLHRDISLGNVMIKTNGSGVLNDWDHSRELPQDAPPGTQLKDAPNETSVPFRTGTWQFMSIHILEQPNRRHSILDDIESVYWLLLYCALHWLPHNNPCFDMQLFDEEKVQRRVALPPLVFGGSKKRLFLMMSEYSQLEFESKPLNDLLHGLADQFYAIYLAELVREESYRQRAKQASERLEDVTVVLGMFEDALRREDWPQEKDRVSNQFRSKTENEETRDDHDSTIESFGSHSHTSFSATPHPESQYSTSSSVDFSESRAKSTRSCAPPKLSKRGSKKSVGAGARKTDPMHKRALVAAASTSSSTDSNMPESFLPMPSTPPSRSVAGPSGIGGATWSSSRNLSMAASTSSSKRGWEEASGDPEGISSTPTKKQRRS